MTLAAYPCFAKVAELVGQLTAIQGDCRATEIHRRMEEQFGQREGTRRMTNMAPQTQADWGSIKRTDREQDIVRRQPIRLSDDRVVARLIEVALRYTGRAVSASTVGSMAVLFPFGRERPLAMAIVIVMAQNEGLELWYHGPGQRLVDIWRKTRSLTFESEPYADRE